MKKQIIIAALTIGAFVLGTTNTQAQTGTNSNAVKTTVKLILSDVISIDSGAAVDGIVNFNYTTSSDYNSAKNVTVAESLVITSSNNFDVKVKADGETFKDGPNNIPVDVLQIKAVTGGTMAGTYNTITLSKNDQKLVSNATFGAKKSLSIDYSISAEKASTELLGKPAGTYSQKIKYTATAL